MEKLYYDLMFSLGTGAAVKLDIDITSEFALLPDVPLSVDQTLNIIKNLGHSSQSSTPIPTAQANSSEQANSEVFAHERVVDLEVSRDQALAEPADEHCISKYFLIWSSNAAGKPARRRPDSARPSDVLPEAWADFGASQRKSVEAEFSARRTLLRRQISELQALHVDLDFNQLVRTTSTGAVALIVRPPLSSSGPWHDDSIDAHPFGAIARHANSFGAIARQTHQADSFRGMAHQILP